MAKKKVFIRNLQDLCDHFGADDAAGLNRRVYKDTACGASISVRVPHFKCDLCRAFEEKFRCSAETHGECDCPKCQGMCRCDRDAWIHNGQDERWQTVTEIDAFTIQTIVEGSDATVDGPEMVLPVTYGVVNNWVEDMESEADRLWKEANEGEYDEEEGRDSVPEPYAGPESFAINAGMALKLFADWHMDENTERDGARDYAHRLLTRLYQEAKEK